MTSKSPVRSCDDMDEQALFDYAYGSIVVEAKEDLQFEAAELIGQTVEESAVTFNGEKFCIDCMQKVNSEKFCQIYPDRGIEGGTTRRSLSTLARLLSSLSYICPHS